MSLVITEPTVCRIEGVDKSSLLPHLKYTDKRVEYDIIRLKRQLRYVQPDDEETASELNTQITLLKKERNKSLLFEDEEGVYTLSGLAHSLGRLLHLHVENKVIYPEPEPLSINEKFPPRDYQVKAHDLLLESKHGAVEIGTGLGKSKIIEMLVASLGLKTLIMAPSVNIAEQLHAQLTESFGKKYVGSLYGGKKESHKLIVVGVSASLTLIEPDDEIWKNLVKTKVFIADESHMTPADTLKKVCTGLVKGAPYRFFFSGTQTRSDGQEIVLQGITGKIVMRMTVKEGVELGYLSQPLFKMVPIISRDRYRSDIPDRMTNKHLRYNPQVLRIAGMIANKSIGSLNRQTVILIDELEQFSKLLPFLKYPVQFAHGPLNAKTKALVPEQYQRSNPHKLVEQFNQGEFPLLIGTSCISIGTDLKTVGCIIYLVGGMSEIQVKQAVGRSTRGGTRGSVTKPDDSKWWGWDEKKTDCYYWDFDVKLAEDLDPEQDRLTLVARHSAERRALYEGIYGPVVDVKLE